MDEKSKNEIIKIIMKSGRMDLAAVMLTLFDELDSDWEPDDLTDEPFEEWNEGKSVEEEIDPAVDEDGFCYLK